jgi:hypothetical protein
MLSIMLTMLWYFHFLHAYCPLFQLYMLTTTHLFNCTLFSFYDHKSDTEFFNKPLEHYAAMSTIFKNSMVTEKYAKGSNERLGVDDADHKAVEEEDNDVPTTPATATNHELGASSSATRLNKRVKTVDLDSDPLVVAFTSSSHRLAKAIEKLT